MLGSDPAKTADRPPGRCDGETATEGIRPTGIAPGPAPSPTLLQVSPPSRERHRPLSKVPAKTRFGSWGSAATHCAPDPSSPIKTWHRPFSQVIRATASPVAAKKRNVVMVVLLPWGQV